MSQATIVIIAVLGFLLGLSVLVVWAYERERQMHVHKWQPIGAKLRDRRGWPLAGVQTAVLWRCKDDPMVDTTLIDEEWTLAEITGLPAPALASISPAAAPAEEEPADGV